MQDHFFNKDTKTQEVVINSEELSIIEENEEMEASPEHDGKISFCTTAVQTTEEAKMEVSSQCVGVSLSSSAAQTTGQQRQEKSSQTRLLQLKETSVQCEVKTIHWEDPDLDTVATQIQAGVRGLQARELMKKEDKEAAETAIKKNKEIEKNLGIDLSDPEIIKATTKIQAGFRGFHARQLQLFKRPLTPAIFISKPEDSKTESEETEYTYTYEAQ